jgi:hypothetical protein
MPLTKCTGVKVRIIDIRSKALPMDWHYQNPSTNHCVIKYIHIKHSVFDDIGQTVVELAKNWLRTGSPLTIYSLSRSLFTADFHSVRSSWHRDPFWGSWTDFAVLQSELSGNLLPAVILQRKNMKKKDTWILPTKYLFHTRRIFNVSYIYDMGPMVLLLVRRKVCYGILTSLKIGRNSYYYRVSLTLWSRSSSKCYLRIHSVPQREHHTSPFQRSTG